MAREPSIDPAAEPAVGSRSPKPPGGEGVRLPMVGHLELATLGHWELIVILVVVMLIFGPSQLPKLAKGIGRSIKSFKSGMKEAAADEDEGGGAGTKGEIDKGDRDKAEKKELPDRPPEDT